MMSLVEHLACVDAQYMKIGCSESQSLSRDIIQGSKDVGPGFKIYLDFFFFRGIYFYLFIYFYCRNQIFFFNSNWKKVKKKIDCGDGCTYL